MLDGKEGAMRRAMRWGALVMVVTLAGLVSASAQEAAEPPPLLRGVHFNPQSPSPPGTSHWLADYHLIRERVRGELAELVRVTGFNFVDVMVLIPLTLRERATAPRDGAAGVVEWANLQTLDNLVAFLDDCHAVGLCAEVDLACNLWLPLSVDTEHHIGNSEWWPKPDDDPWTEAAVWYEQMIRYVEERVRAPESIALWTMMGNHQWGGAEPVTWDWPECPEVATYTERFVKAVWPRVRQAATRPVGSPILLPILADTPYWNEKTPAQRLSSFSNMKRWLVDDLALPPDYWVMSTYPCCDPATDGFPYLAEIVRILGPENAGRILSTDFKGAGADLSGCIVDKSGLSDAQVLRWHFDKVAQYGFGGWWIWAYQDTETDKTGLRTVEGAWKAELVEAATQSPLRRGHGE